MRTKRYDELKVVKTKRYDELKVGDEVIFHGNNVRIVDIKRMPYTEEAYKNECTEEIALI